MTPSLKFFLILLLGAWQLPAQIDVADSRAELEARHARKISKSFLKLVPFARELTEACRTARAERKFILAYLTRSYAVCPSCDQFEETVLVEPWWITVAAEVVPYVSITSRLPGHVDQEILRDLGGTRYPFVAFLDDEGHTLWPFVMHDEASFRAAQQKATAVFAYREWHRAHPQDADAEVRWLSLLLRWNRLPAERARLESLAAGSLGPSAREFYVGHQASSRFSERQARLESESASLSQNRRRALTAAFRSEVLQWASEGLHITDPDDPHHISFWIAVGFGAKAAKSPLLNRALVELRAREDVSWLPAIIAEIGEGSDR